MLDRRLALDPNLVFNAPLRQLDGATFMSRDQNGISCANSLAKWQLKSLLWDGADSIINCGKDIRIANIFDNGGTISFWINPKSDGENNYGHIFCKIPGWRIFVSDESAEGVKIRFLQYYSGDDGYWLIDSREIKIGVWNNVAMSYDNGNTENKPIVYVNGKEYIVGDGMIETITPVGTRILDGEKTLYIGNISTYDRTFDGNMTDMRLYNRILSGIEIQRIYNRTKRFFC